MGSPRASSLFHNFMYEKSVDEILAMTKKKIEAVDAKIAEREARVLKIRKEYDISDADLISVLAQAASEGARNVGMSYNINSGGEARLLGAGIVQNLLTEQKLIEQEKDSVKHLKLVGRNLGPITHHASGNGAAYVQTTFTLSEDDLEYLGF